MTKAAEPVAAFILVVGDPTTGLSFVGPFASEAEAQDNAREFLDGNGERWTTALLYAPERA